jgi:hypothetical protein
MAFPNKKSQNPNVRASPCQSVSSAIYDNFFCKNVVDQDPNLWFNDSVDSRNPIIGDMIDVRSCPRNDGAVPLPRNNLAVGKERACSYEPNKEQAAKKRPKRTSLPFTEEVNPIVRHRPLARYRWRLPQEELHGSQSMQSES